MKNKKVWVTVLVIIVIIAILIWGSKTNWWGLQKTTTTVANAVQGAVKRLIAPLPGSQSDYSELSASGKPLWLYVGAGSCPSGYAKNGRTEDNNYCKLI